MTGYDQSPDYDLDRRARELGQNDPTVPRWEVAANDHGSVRPDWRPNLFLTLLAFVLIGAAVLAFF